MHGAAILIWALVAVFLSTQSATSTTSAQPGAVTNTPMAFFFEGLNCTGPITMFTNTYFASYNFTATVTFTLASLPSTTCANLGVFGSKDVPGSINIPIIAASPYYSSEFIRRLMNVTSWSAEPFIFVDSFRSENGIQPTCPAQTGNLMAFRRTGYRVGACTPNLIDVPDARRPEDSVNFKVDGWFKYSCVTQTTCADNKCSQNCTTKLLTVDGVCNDGTMRTCVDSEVAYQNSYPTFGRLAGPSSASSSNLSVAGIVVIVVGAAGGVALVVFGVVLFQRCKRAQGRLDEPAKPESDTKKVTLI